MVAIGEEISGNNENNLDALKLIFHCSLKVIVHTHFLGNVSLDFKEPTFTKQSHQFLKKECFKVTK